MGGLDSTPLFANKPTEFDGQFYESTCQTHWKGVKYVDLLLELIVFIIVNICMDIL